MTSPFFEPQSGLLSDEFAQQVKELFVHLHDFGYLQNHPISSMLDTTGNSHQELGWELIRREILLAIESLSPGANPPITSPRARSYHMLNLHYLEENPIQQCAVELGISIRQANRELRRAEQSVAAILWSKLSDRLRRGQPQVLNDTLPSEIDQLHANFEPVDMIPMIQEASREVVILAQEHGCQLIIPEANEPIVILTDKMIARQALIAIFSSLIQTARPCELKLDFFAEVDNRGMRVSFYTAADTDLFLGEEPFFAQLCKHIDWKLEYSDTDPLVCKIIFETNSSPILLVIDDNEGIGLLLERYLAGSYCRLITASNGIDGLHLASQFEPDAILLDVMMPGMDGWKVLNQLKSDKKTREIPVIVCSVFNDPRLARSMGAVYLLPKPLNRDMFLGVIRQIGL